MSKRIDGAPASFYPEVVPKPLAYAVLALALVAGACGSSSAASPSNAAATPTVVASETPTRLATALPTATKTPAPPAESTPTATPWAPTGEPVGSPTPMPSSEVVPLSEFWLEVAVPPLPIDMPSRVWDDELAKRIATALDGRNGDFGVVVYQLTSGRYALHDSDHVFYAASLYKLPILLEAFRQRDAGLINMDQALTLEARHVANDMDTLSGLGLQEGDQITLGDALWAMTVVSDTSCAVLVAELLGSESIDATLQSLGLRDTSVSTPELPTTADDMAGLLTAFAAGLHVSDTSRQEALSMLLQQEVYGGILLGLPEDVPVGHKTGNWDNATHDVGIVWSRAGPYIITILTDAAWDWEPIAEVSRAVYQYFLEAGA